MKAQNNLRKNNEIKLMKNVINLNKFSKEILKRIQKVLKIVLDELEFQGINELTGNKVPLKRFEKEWCKFKEKIND